ncbi:hypothetical protein Kisp01_01990 [Kineosporia sp. NBRC 101677]|nr:hypothetical protein Kisp01_01990 [Kineosporia sp. NBRC 101677]
MGMNDPRRNSAMIATVKKILRRRSGVRNARKNAVSTQNLQRAALAGQLVVTGRERPSGVRFGTAVRPVHKTPVV